MFRGESTGIIFLDQKKRKNYKRFNTKIIYTVNVCNLSNAAAIALYHFPFTKSIILSFA